MASVARAICVSSLRSDGIAGPLTDDELKICRQ